VKQHHFILRSPYGVAKLYAYWIVKNYRESYNLFACNGILFNHEGVRRGHTFVTRKITLGLGKILRGEESKLLMGNINSLRDWGNAKDYVEGMWLMLQHDKPDDYVLATGTMHSIKDFIEEAFKLRGFNILWKGDGVDEVGYDKNTGRELIFIDKKYFRPAEVEQLLGDATKAKKILGWVAKTTFKDLVKEMVDNDC
jgi:GDPmannose 4,6-dehydratase